MDDKLLLSVARQFEKAIAPHGEAFQAHGIAIEVLGRLIDPFETAVNDAV